MLFEDVPPGPTGVIGLAYRFVTMPQVLTPSAPRLASTNSIPVVTLSAFGQVTVLPKVISPVSLLTETLDSFLAKGYALSEMDASDWLAPPLLPLRSTAEV